MSPAASFLNSKTRFMSPDSFLQTRFFLAVLLVTVFSLLGDQALHT